MEMGLEEIQQILPHRYPFLLLDRILELVPDERVVGLKNVTINEPFFQGHFPGKPIMPGVLIVEAMAQTGGVLAFKSNPQFIGKRMFYFLSLDKVKFRRPVVPGDTLRMEVSVLRKGQKVWKMQAKAFVGQTLTAEAELTAALSEDQETSSERES